MMKKTEDDNSTIVVVIWVEIGPISHGFYNVFHKLLSWHLLLSCLLFAFGFFTNFSTIFVLKCDTGISGGSPPIWFQVKAKI